MALESFSFVHSVAFAFFILFVAEKVTLKVDRMERIALHKACRSHLRYARFMKLLFSQLAWILFASNVMILFARNSDKLNKYIKGESWKWIDRLVTHDRVTAFAICLETDLFPWLPRGGSDDREQLVSEQRGLGSWKVRG